MSADTQVITEMDCFHRYYRFRQCDAESESGTSRYEAWLDYKQAILRRAGYRCSVCDRLRAPADLEVRCIEERRGQGLYAPDNLACVCSDCGEPAEHSTEEQFAQPPRTA